MSAEALLTIDQVAKELQITKDKLLEMVKSGLIRGFRDQNTYKFRPADVQVYKKKVAGGLTEISDASETPSATSKIDLEEIDSDSGIEESDQTSVMAPIDDVQRVAPPEETPVFKFSDNDLGLQDEEEEASPVPMEEADQTSLLAPTEEEEAKKESKPTFDFTEKDALKLPLDDEGGESVLVADESESSIDILEVAEESSSESSASASAMGLADESSSGEEVTALTDIEDSPAAMAAVDSTDKTVTDILGAADESDEELESLDLETFDTQETIMEEAPSDEALAAELPADATDTVPVAGEAETVGIAAGDETRFTEEEAGETAAVSDVVADALKEAGGEDEEEELPLGDAESGKVVVPTGWEMVVPSTMGNALLIAATVLLVLGGVFLICGMFQPPIDNGFTQWVVKTVSTNL